MYTARQIDERVLNIYVTHRVEHNGRKKMSFVARAYVWYRIGS
jgi:hypothetical protein